MTQNSKQSQNKKKSVSDFHNSCNEKEKKKNHIKNWKNIM